jgi:hypothetical protein
LKVKTADGVLQTMYDLLEELAAGEPSARPA